MDRNVYIMNEEWMGNRQDTCPANSKFGETILGFGLWIFDHFQDEKDAQRNLEQDGGLQSFQSLLKTVFVMVQPIAVTACCNCN